MIKTFLKSQRMKLSAIVVVLQCFQTSINAKGIKLCFLQFATTCVHQTCHRNRKPQHREYFVEKRKYHMAIETGGISDLVTLQ